MQTRKQVMSSSWDGRPFHHNRHGPHDDACVRDTTVKLYNYGAKATTAAEQA